jgi:hypothetical protein
LSFSGTFSSGITFFGASSFFGVTTGATAGAAVQQEYAQQLAEQQEYAQQLAEQQL